jgi:UDP-N-acetylglucosamine acyltransferase
MRQPLNYIDPQAQLGKGVTVGPFTVIEADVIIGEGTWIGPHVTILSGARIGRHCQIFSGAVIAAIPQDLKFQGEPTTVTIGDRTVVREYVTISRGTAADGETIIGQQVLLMAYVHVAHDCKIGNHCIVANAVQMAGHVHIANYANIGGAVAIRQFVKIGAYAMVSGGSLVKKDVPPFIKVAREPLKYCGLNKVGLSRHSFSDEQMQILQRIYSYIFQQDLPLPDALACIRQEIQPCAEKEAVLAFIQESERGIVKGVL